MKKPLLVLLLAAAAHALNAQTGGVTASTPDKAVSNAAAHALNAQTGGWYPFTPSNDHDAPSAIGMDAWNAEPAGTHGRVERQGDKLVYNGEEIKLWGLNNTYRSCAPSKEMAEKRAAMYRKFGVNAMRLHKYADGPGWAGIQSETSFINFDPEGLDQMDYYVAELKENGIYTKLSPTFGIAIGVDEIERIPYHEEIGELRRNRVKARHGWVSIAEEIQDLQIEQTVQLLNHTNPYTGMRYADDPAIFCVELYNEDSVLFFGTNSKFQRSPTMRERHGRAFADWLIRKYETTAAWEAAWGEDAIVSDPSDIEPGLRNLIDPAKVTGDLESESLGSGTVIPWGQPWYYDAAMNPDSDQAFLKQRFLDTMEYLIGLQDEFYGKFVNAIRETGFDGEIIASNWQAGSLVGHYLNLFSDYQVGTIDRHNYFGGNRRALKGQQPFRSGSMLARPGMGSLSAGFQQVDDRPFMLSEWIHVQPNEWYAEGPAILGAYGWGLQGWDISYIFQNTDDGEFTDELLKQAWDVANPAILAVFATVSREVRRFDVKEAPETHTLNVHVDSLLEGELDFRNETTQAWDEKSFTTDKVPMEALAATRVAVDFTAEPQETEVFDIDAYRDGDAIVSSTGQLRWTPSKGDEPQGGHVTIDTDGTKAFIGFAPGGQAFDLGDGYSIAPEKGFAVIHLSAKGENETLANAKEIVVTAMARARNSGMIVDEEKSQIVKPGAAPIMLEPVKAAVKTPFSGELLVLDQDGIAPTATREIDGTFVLDGAKDKTPFYLIKK